MSQSTLRLGIILLILLVAACVRLWQLGDAPPGLQHDEIFKAHEGQAIVKNGDIRIFYPSNQGHEGGYVWLLGLSYLLFGANMVMLKMPPVWCGLLTVALLYRFAREVFGYRSAVIAAGLAGVCFWWMFTNRVGLRANLLPLVTLLVLWGLWRVCFHQPDQPGRRWKIALFTGGILGLAIYTYTASIALYAAYGLFLLALAMLDRPTLRRCAAELAIITLLGFLLTLPMVNYRLNDPQGQNRVSTINMPWTELKKGNPDPVLENARLLLGMPVFSGDPEWRYNLAGRPLFGTPVGLLVYLGFGIMLWRSRRNPLNVMLLGLAIFGLIPSLLTIAAPSFLRSIITLPSLMIFVALAIDQLAHLGSSKRFSQLAWWVGILVIFITGATDWSAYFDEWKNSRQVYAIYRDDLQQLANTLHDEDESLVLVSTDEPAILDPSIYAFSNAPSDTNLMWFDGTTDIVLRDQPTLLFVSPLSPISPAHADWLTPEMGTLQLDPIRRQDGEVAFQAYRLSAYGNALQDKLEQVAQHPVYLAPPPPFPSENLLDWGIPFEYPVNFGNVLQLVGVEMPRTEIPYKDDGIGNGLNLQLYFQPLVEDLGEPLSIFVHIVAWDGVDVYAGRDFLGVPPTSWETGTTFIQDQYIGDYELPVRPYFVAMGLYNTVTFERYPILDKDGNPIADRIFLGQVNAVPINR